MTVQEGDCNAQRDLASPIVRAAEDALWRVLPDGSGYSLDR
jgi:hypothetical protein